MAWLMTVMWFFVERKWTKEVRKFWILALLQWRTLFLSVCFTTCAFSSGDLHCTRGMNCSSITFFWSLLESVSMMALFWKCLQILGNAQIWKSPLKIATQPQTSSYLLKLEANWFRNSNRYRKVAPVEVTIALKIQWNQMRVWKDCLKKCRLQWEVYANNNAGTQPSFSPTVVAFSRQDNQQ